jgi:hypothetical protein
MGDLRGAAKAAHKGDPDFEGPSEAPNLFSQKNYRKGERILSLQTILDDRRHRVGLNWGEVAMG